MGLLIEGKWHDKWYDTESTGGKFKRQDSSFRNWVTPDGIAGPTGSDGFKAAPGRYHLYVSLACPWAHRTLIFRKIKGLEGAISLSVVNPYMRENGWTFEPEDGVIADPIHNAKYMHEIYTSAKNDYTGRVTVPVLWDKETNRLVNNESADIIRMLNSAFDDVGATEGDFYPKEKREAIDDINEYVYHNINNGVYKAGFATKQDVYTEEVTKLFEALDKVENILSKSRYLIGDSITEADWRLFTTLIRFDAVYVGHFKCNLKRIIDYPNIWNYLLELYQVGGIADTVNLFHIKHHYYGSHDTINPTLIVPEGPDLDFTLSHNRAG
ncbi:MAG: glutathione S-transferase family protein [Gammaproteobacteria bacterium]|nr:glutathione S-transferase family protein [Gammaproteobacteria bacterium]